MRKTFLLLLLPFVTLHCFSQDSLVLLPELEFSSPFEKKAFHRQFEQKSDDLFDIFMASGQILSESKVAAAKDRFSNHLTEINTERLNAKKNDKKVKFIYGNIHDTFLVKYELRNSFEDIFVNGFYNCVSASALYGLAFEKLNIPFVIKEKPTHVYLIAYPDSERIMVETTAPAGGFYVANAQFKQNFVKMLKDQKLITAGEYASQSVDELFDKFYYGEDKDISLVELAGIQYLNAGLYLLEDKKFIDATHAFEKAYLLYPSERIGYLLMATTHQAFNQRENKDTVHAALLSKLARHKKYGITGEMIEGEFMRVIQGLLFEKGEKEKLELYFNKLHASIADAELKNQLAFLYHYENGRLLYNQARYRESIPFFEACLKIKPNHLETNRILIACIADLLKNKANIEAIRALEDFSKRFPVLMENNIFKEMLGTSYLIEARLNFQNSRAADGEKYKLIFEEFYGNNSDISYHTNLIGEAYSAAAVYYFRKGQTAKARAVIARGLELAPNNYELQTRKRMID